MGNTTSWWLYILHYYHYFIVDKRRLYFKDIKIVFKFKMDIRNGKVWSTVILDGKHLDICLYIAHTLTNIMFARTENFTRLNATSTLKHYYMIFCHSHTGEVHVLVIFREIHITTGSFRMQSIHCKVLSSYCVIIIKFSHFAKVHTLLWIELIVQYSFIQLFVKSIIIKKHVMQITVFKKDHITTFCSVCTNTSFKDT